MRRPDSNTGSSTARSPSRTGRLLGVVPKAYLPNYREFEEVRWFRPGTEVAPGIPRSTSPWQTRVPFGLDILFRSVDEDLVARARDLRRLLGPRSPERVSRSARGRRWSPTSRRATSPIGKAELRRLLARSASDRGKCAYLYVAAGPGESSTDLAFDADAFICENGRHPRRSRCGSRATNQLVTADVDLDLLVRERASTTTFGDCSREHRREYRSDRAIALAGEPSRTAPADTSIRIRFLPKNPATLATRCWEIFEIQSNALATRMTAIGAPKLILGLSGGLDSSMAALVCAQALRLNCGQPSEDLIAVTMPGLGTTEQTRSERRGARRRARRHLCRGRRSRDADSSLVLARRSRHGAVDGCRDRTMRSSTRSATEPSARGCHGRKCPGAAPHR